MRKFFIRQYIILNKLSQALCHCKEIAAVKNACFPAKAGGKFVLKY